MSESLLVAALQEHLEFPEVVQYLGHDLLDDHTTCPTIAIFESDPLVIEQIPSVTFCVENTEPKEEKDISGCYESTVLITCTDKDQTSARFLADLVVRNMKQSSQEISNKRYWNITTDCITNSYTRIRRRMKVANSRSSNVNSDTDTVKFVIELMISWCECPCSGEPCRPDPPESCEPEIPEYIDPDCCEKYS